MDRRVQKTKKALSEALIALILEKGFDQVSVQDILDRANVGRATFYTHYENKELLLVDGHRNLGHQFFDAAKDLDFLPLFEHVAENLPLAKALLGKAGGETILEMFRENLLQAFLTRIKKPRESGRYRARAAAAAIGALISTWVDEDLALSPREMASLAKDIAASALP